MRLTVPCPVAHADDANALAMVLAEGPPDALTYVNAGWQDAAGNLYAPASFQIGPTFLPKATSALVRPSWDTGNLVNMTGAARAQALIRLVMPNEAIPLATPDVILAVVGDDALAALAAMGLSLVTTEL